eukprot:6330763-Pyramimonas_sp.AAC.1
MWCQELHHAKAKSDSWGSTETRDLIGEILAGPDRPSWTPSRSSDLLGCAAAGLLAWQREGGAWAE